MSFSAFNVGRQMIVFTGNNNPTTRIANKPVAGGSFTPSTLEAAFVMRSTLDYQFEKAFLDKHKAKMQNRLNELSKKLQESYTDLLNVSMSQQVGQEADKDLRADVILDGTDVNGASNLIEGILGSNGFEDIGIVPKTDSRVGESLNESSMNYDGALATYQAQLAAAQASGLNNDIWRAPGIKKDHLDSTGVYADDGVTGYGRLIEGVGEVQFKTLTDRATAAGNVAGDLNITMRIEDDPPIPEDGNQNLNLLNSVTSGLLGGPPPPTYFNQKISQENTQFKTGGFWSAVNYLYNFAPQEIKYSYAVGYTANTDEAGNDEYLIDGELINIRDNPNDNDFDGTEDDPQGYLAKDKRVKWASFDPTEGYQHERSGTSANYPTVVNREKAWQADGKSASVHSGIELWDLTQTEGDGNVKIIDNLIFQSGTYTYNPNDTDSGAFFANQSGGLAMDLGGALTAGSTSYEDVNANGTYDAGIDVLRQYSGTSNGVLTSLRDSNIEAGSIFRTKVDMTINATDDSVVQPSASQDMKINDRGTIKSSLFFNHYEIETRTVEYNNSARKDVDDLWDATGNPSRLSTEDVSDDGTGKIYTYGGIVRSKSIDATKSYDWVDENPNNGTDTDKEITRSAGSMSNTFNGEYLQSLHKIESYNGLDIVSNDPKQASPIMGNFKLGEYDGLMKSYEMSRNLLEYVKPLAVEVNAANSVPTNWHQTEMLEDADPADPANGFVWFPFIEDTLYSAKPEDTDGFDTKTGYGRLGAPRQLIQARNTFSLSNEEFMRLQPAANWVSDSQGVRRPTYEKRNYFVNLDLRGVHFDAGVEEPKIFVNGREVISNGVLPGVPNIALVNNTVTSATNNISDLTYEINLKEYLQEGYNTITIQTSDGSYDYALGSNNYDEGIRITEMTGLPTTLTDYDKNTNTSTAYVAGDENDAIASAAINAKIITGYDNVQAVAYSPDMERLNTRKVQSRWQARIIPTSAAQDPNNNLVRMASAPSSTGTSFKVANSFIELIINTINQEKYRDIFKLGLISNLNKLAVTGSANLPNGANMQGSLSLYYDQLTQSMVVDQDKLIAKS